jgi:hypothetical protein
LPGYIVHNAQCGLLLTQEQQAATHGGVIGPLPSCMFVGDTPAKQKNTIGTCAYAPVFCAGVDVGHVGVDANAVPSALVVGTVLCAVAWGAFSSPLAHGAKGVIH